MGSGMKCIGSACVRSGGCVYCMRVLCCHWCRFFCFVVDCANACDPLNMWSALLIRQSQRTGIHVGTVAKCVCRLASGPAHRRAPICNLGKVCPVGVDHANTRRCCQLISACCSNIVMRTNTLAIIFINTNQQNPLCIYALID